MTDMIGKSVSDAMIDASKAKAKSQDKLFSPNAQEDQETVTGSNPQKAWLGSGGRPKGPFGPRGRLF